MPASATTNAPLSEICMQVDLSTAAAAAELHEAVKNLVETCRCLKAELNCAYSVIDELEDHNNRLHTMLADALAAISTPQSSNPPNQARPETLGFVPNSGDTWIRGTWLLSHPSDRLHPIELVWQSGQAQRALVLLATHLTLDLEVNERVSAKLLTCAILRCNGCHERALLEAEEALDLAEASNLRGLKGRAMCQRGFCYLHLNKLREARWCFVLGNSANGYQKLVDINMEMLDRRFENSTEDDPGWSIPDDSFFHLPSRAAARE